MSPFRILSFVQICPCVSYKNKSMQPYILQTSSLHCFIFHVSFWQIANTTLVKNEKWELRSLTCVDELLVLGNMQILQQPLNPLCVSGPRSTLSWKTQKDSWPHSMKTYPSLQQGLPISLWSRENMKPWKLLSWRPTVSLEGNCFCIQYCLSHYTA